MAGVGGDSERFGQDPNRQRWAAADQQAVFVLIEQIHEFVEISQKLGIFPARPDKFFRFVITSTSFYRQTHKS